MRVDPDLRLVPSFSRFIGRNTRLGSRCRTRFFKGSEAPGCGLRGPRRPVRWDGPRIGMHEELSLRLSLRPRRLAYRSWLCSACLAIV